MTLKEAYELLDLPEGSDIQLVRARFSEQHSEYRMLIDNAPTPNLRQRYEQNLALREEAFQLINGGSNLDDAADLPNTGPSSYTEPTRTATPGFSLPEALALLGLTETDSTDTIESTYNSHKADLEAALRRGKIESTNQAYTHELKQLAKAWAVIEPWWKAKLASESKTKEQATQTQAKSTKAPAPKEQAGTQRINKTALWLGLGIVAAIAALLTWYYANTNNPDPYTTQTVGLDTEEAQPSKNTEPLITKETDEDVNDNIASVSPTKEVSTKKKGKQYNYIDDFHEGLAYVELGSKGGFIDKTGKEVISLKYDGAGRFSEGLAGVYLDGKWGFIDKTGKEIIPLIYDGQWGFEGGMALVNLDGKYIYINKTGNYVKDYE